MSCSVLGSWGTAMSDHSPGAPMKTHKCVPTSESAVILEFSTLAPWRVREREKFPCQVNTLTGVQDGCWVSRALAIKCQSFWGRGSFTWQGEESGFQSSQHQELKGWWCMRAEMLSARWGVGGRGRGDVRKDFTVEATPGCGLAGPSGWRIPPAERRECPQIEDRLKKMWRAVLWWNSTE